MTEKADTLEKIMTEIRAQHIKTIFLEYLIFIYIKATANGT